jgi:hypothetical protein
MPGRRKRPNAMVTHTWHSRFRDLVASVVAEALQAAGAISQQGCCNGFSKGGGI